MGLHMNWSGGSRPIEEVAEEYFNSWAKNHGEPNVRMHVTFDIWVNEEVGWVKRGMTSNFVITPTISKELHGG